MVLLVCVWRAYSSLRSSRQVSTSAVHVCQGAGLQGLCSGLAHLLLSPFASLCFLLYATRSLKVKPSCAVMKLTLCCGPRPPSHFLPPLFAHQLPACPCSTA